MIKGFYQIIDENYIASYGYGYGGTPITEGEYEAIKAAVLACPAPPEGKAYRLRGDLTWELYDLPIPEPTPITPEDLMTALEEIL